MGGQPCEWETEGGERDVQPERLLADRVEERERAQLVVRDVLPAARREDLLPDLVLHVLVLGQQLQYLRHHVRRRVRRHEKQDPVAGDAQR